MTLSTTIQIINHAVEKHCVSVPLLQAVLNDLFNNPIAYEKGYDMIQNDGSFIRVTIKRTGWIKKIFCVLTRKPYTVYNVSVSRQ